MALSALRSVGDAIEATRSFLLGRGPRRWVALAVAVAFMGTPGTPAPANPQFLDPTLWRGPQPEPPTLPEDGPEGSAELPLDLLSPSTWPGWLLGLVVAAVGLYLAYQVVGVLARFVLVEALASDDVRLRGQARANVRPALRVVGFRAGLAVLAAPVMLALLVAVAPVGPVTLDGIGAAVAGAVATAVALAVWLVDAATLQFVVPTMVATDGGVLAAWRRFAGVLRRAWTEYVAFVLVRAAIGIAVGIAAAVGLGVALALGAVVAVTAAAVTVAVAGGVSALGPGGLLALGLVALAFLAYAVVVAALVAVPFQVYLWTYSLFVLGDTAPELDLLGDLREAVRSDGSL